MNSIAINKVRVLQFLLIFTTFLLSSCEKEVVKKPKNLIEKDKMISVLYDLSVLAAMRSHNPALLDSFKNNSNKYIYKKHKIDSLQFTKSNMYYAADYEEYKAIHEAVKLKLTTDKASIELAIKTDKKKQKIRQKKLNALKIKKTKDSIQLVLKRQKIKAAKTADSIRKIALAKTKTIK